MIDTSKIRKAKGLRKNPANSQASAGLSRGALIGLSVIGVASVATAVIILNKKKKSDEPSQTASKQDSSKEVAKAEAENTLKDIDIEMYLCKRGSVDVKDVSGKQVNESLSAFYIAKKEVTQELFEQVMGFNPSYFTAEKGYPYPASNLRPVEYVTLDQVVEFCNKLSIAKGLEPYYTKNPSRDGEWLRKVSANGYRLPTVSEWLWAATSGNDQVGLLSPNIGPDAEALIGPYGWFIFNSNATTHPVGTRKPNKWGLYDMIGNVNEMVWDTYDVTLNKDIYSTRGGDYGSGTAARWGSIFFGKVYSPQVGFRLARNV